MRAIFGEAIIGAAMSRAWATTEEQGTKLTAWARQHGLRYERYGMLPAASELLDPGVSPAADTVRVASRLPIEVPLPEQDTRDRWAENLCSGLLPGRLEGTLAHHASWYRTGDDQGWRIGVDTVVVARVLEGIAVARDLEARTNWPTEFLFEREYGPEYKYVGQGALRWKVPVEEDEGLVRAAVGQVPPTAHYSLRDGMVVARIEGGRDDPPELDALCLGAAAFADGLRAVARSQRPLLSADALPDPRPTPYRQWTDAGADRMTWRHPPPDLDSAITSYAELASSDPQVRRRSKRGRKIILGLFGAFGLLAGAMGFAVATVAGIPAVPVAALGAEDRRASPADHRQGLEHGLGDLRRQARATARRA